MLSSLAGTRICGKPLGGFPALRGLLWWERVDVVLPVDSVTGLICAGVEDALLIFECCREGGLGREDVSLGFFGGLLEVVGVAGDGATFADGTAFSALGLVLIGFGSCEDVPPLAPRPLPLPCPRALPPLLVPFGADPDG
jgi:hypothetical protein